MKTISIQVQLERDVRFNENQLLPSLQELGFNPDVKDGHDDEGRYINYYIDTNDLSDTWQKIRTKIISNQAVANSCIVICQGDHGWEDLLFLHHYDPKEQLDDL
jgi:hypothetical protein